MAKELSQADVDYFEAVLDVIGVPQRPSGHAPVAWPKEPKPKTPEKSQGWKPTFKNEAPPF